MADQTITLLGGSGFLGRHIVARLAADGLRLRVAVRRPEKALFLKPMGDVGQIELVQANLRHPESLARAMEGADAAINLVGLLHESGRQRFASVHVDGAGAVAEAAAKAGVRRLIHVSAIGADANSDSAYARTKAGGEAAVKAAFPKATLIRPSVVFGPEDKFFNRFAGLARISPMLPLIGGGRSRFQPVFCGDVAAGVARSLSRPETAGRTYEFGGPRIYTFRQLMELVLACTGRRRALVPLPVGLAKFDAWFLQLLPNPLLTVDQVKLVMADNIVAEDAATLADLGVEARAAESVVASYLGRFRETGQFAAVAGS